MIRLSSGLTSELFSLASDDITARKMLRARTVERVFREAVTDVYGNNAFLILKEVNAVYILREDEGEACASGVRSDAAAKPDAPAVPTKRLVVYAVDSTIRASLVERREHLKAALAARGEAIGEFTVQMSRFNMKKRHPYTEEASPELRELKKAHELDVLRETPLTAFQKAELYRASSPIEDDHLRRKFSEAMEAHFKRENSGIDKNFA